MDFLLSIIILLALAYVGIKLLKVFFGFAIFLLLANLLAPVIGVVATILVLAFLFLSRRTVSNGLIIFICLAFIFGVIF